MAVAKNCSHLRCLDISYCRHINQDALMVSAPHRVHA